MRSQLIQAMANITNSSFANNHPCTPQGANNIVQNNTVGSNIRLLAGSHMTSTNGTNGISSSSMSVSTLSTNSNVNNIGNVVSASVGINMNGNYNQQSTSPINQYNGINNGNLTWLKQKKDFS